MGKKICERNCCAGTGESRRGMWWCMSQSWYSSAVHEEDCSDTGFHPAVYGGPHTEAGRCALKPAAAHGDLMLEKVFWQDLWPKRGPMLEQLAPEGLHPVEGTHCRNSWRTAAHRTDQHWSSLWRTVSCMWHPVLEEEKSTSNRHNASWSDHKPHFPSPCLPWEIEISEVNPGKMEGWQDCVLDLLFLTLLIFQLARN